MADPGQAPDSASSNRFLGWIGEIQPEWDLSACDGCDECGLRCAAGVPMSQDEQAAVTEYVANRADRDYVYRVARQDKTVDLGDGVTVQMCPFRDVERGRCVVYPVRPLMCRLMGHTEWMPCPINRVERIIPTESALRMMAAYSSHERKPLESWDWGSAESHEGTE